MLPSIPQHVNRNVCYKQTKSYITPPQLVILCRVYTVAGVTTVSHTQTVALVSPYLERNHILAL